MTQISVTEIDGVRITKSVSTSDSRGSFIKAEPTKEFENTLGCIAISLNPNLGTLRGLHFQIEPFAEEKIVLCVQGSIFDVILDIRPQSKTFGRWATFDLSSANGLQLYLPKGIAHGFQTLEPNTIIQYCLTSSYSKEAAFSINPLCDLGINWPLKESLISDRDASGLLFSDAAKIYAQALKK